LLGEIHQILLNDFSMQMNPETVNYDGKKPRFRRWTVFAKNLGFGVGFGYRNNTTVQCRKVWLTPNTGVPCSNGAKMRNPLKFAGVPQTNEAISAANTPNFTVL